MKHSNKMLTYLIGAVALAAALIAFGVPGASLAPFAIVLLCPLMMVVMMRGLGAMDVTSKAGAWPATHDRNRRLPARAQLNVIADAADPPHRRTVHNRTERGVSCTTGTGTTAGAAERGG